MSKFFDVLASAASEEAGAHGIQCVLEHFAENRDVARYLFAGPPSRDVVPRIAREIAKRIEAHVRARIAKRGLRAQLPPSAIAAQAAEAQIVLVGLWLTHRVDCDAATLARALRASTQASIAALISA
jgi:hypothetical protein